MNKREQGQGWEEKKFEDQEGGRKGESKGKELTIDMTSMGA